MDAFIQLEYSFRVVASMHPSEVWTNIHLEFAGMMPVEDLCCDSRFAIVPPRLRCICGGGVLMVRHIQLPRQSRGSMKSFAEVRLEQMVESVEADSRGHMRWLLKHARWHIAEHVIPYMRNVVHLELV